MKPTDKKHPIEISTQSTPEAPVISRLKRVIDIKSLEPSKTQTTHHSSNTRDNRKSASRPAPKHTDSNHARSDSNHVRSSIRKQASDAVSPVKPKDAGTFSHAATPQTVPAKDPLSPKQRVKVTPKRSDSDHTAAVSPAAPSKPAPQIDPAATENAPSKVLASHKPNTTHSAVHHLRATRIIRPKGKIPLHVTESAGNVSKSRLAMKSKKHAELVLENELSVKQPAPDNVTEKLEEALLLQSWRAKQWNACLTALGPSIQAKMIKCLPLVQAKLVNNLCITAGSLEATIIDQVTSISMRQFTPGQWRAVIAMLSDRAIFTTSLLNGELPEGILSIFKQASLSLFPTKLRDFTFSCTCEAESSPCEHACALLLTFAQALEEDPFHILTLRGMNRDDLLSQLRDARSDQVVDEKNRHRINYELPAQNVDFESFYEPNGNFEDLAFQISYTENTILNRIGNPGPWQAPFDLKDIILPISDMAAQMAENIALNKYPEPSDHPEFTPQKRSDESRAPKKISKNQRFTIPNLNFLYDLLPQDILDTVPGDPIDTAADIIRWLKTRGASDIRTLARRTRLHKTTIEAFLNAFCQAGIAAKEGEEERTRFVATF